jgi:putative peptide zinc metalloprotease protein
LTGGAAARRPSRPEPTPRGDAITSAPEKATRSAGAADGRPQLAEGIELVGEYKDSGYEVPPFIARRADGQTIQMPELLYVIADEADGSSSFEEISGRVSERVKRGLQPDDVRMLVEERLRPLGVLAQADGSSPQLQKVDPLLALKFRVALVSERAVNRIATAFRPFFWPVSLLVVLGAIVAVDVWLFFVHGVGQSARELVYNPLLLLMVFGCIVAATALHEIGHATAARYGGAKPGVMGAGIYVVWPAFYTDVTDAYRLGRWGRVRTDLGGILFNGLFVLGTTGVYLLTSFEPLLVIILLQHFQVLQQLMPLLRFDGYYVLSDLTGVPDLFMRIKPTLQGLIPWRKAADKAKELKPWVRRTVTAWVLLLIPFLGFVFVMMIVNAPRIFATAYDSFWVHVEGVGARWDDGRQLAATVSGLQILALALPAAGMIYSFTRAGSRGVGGAWRWADGRVARQAGVVSASAGVVVLLAFVWWPNGDYRPIQSGERGTVQGAVSQLRELPTGRPGLTGKREQELGGAPTRSDHFSPGSEDSPGGGPAPEQETGPTDTGGSAPAETDGSETTPSETSTTPTDTTETSTRETSTTETTTTGATP